MELRDEDHADADAGTRLRVVDRVTSALLVFLMLCRFDFWMIVVCAYINNVKPQPEPQSYRTSADSASLLMPSNEVHTLTCFLHLDTSVVSYKCSVFYFEGRECGLEGCIRWRERGF